MLRILTRNGPPRRRGERPRPAAPPPLKSGWTMPAMPHTRNGGRPGEAREHAVMLQWHWWQHCLLRAREQFPTLPLMQIAAPPLFTSSPVSIAGALHSARRRSWRQHVPLRSLQQTAGRLLGWPSRRQWCWTPSGPGMQPARPTT
jgi:hypothetical protein